MKLRIDIILLIGTISVSGCAELKVVPASQHVPRNESTCCDEEQQTPAISAQPINEIEKPVPAPTATAKKLNKTAQMKLVIHAFDAIDVETDKQALLLELIGNVDFNCDAKMAILARLKEIRNAEIRTSILQAFHKRRDCIISD
jgi:hypothetical protein